MRASYNKHYRYIIVVGVTACLNSRNPCSAYTLIAAPGRLAICNSSSAHIAYHRKSYLDIVSCYAGHELTLIQSLFHLTPDTRPTTGSLD